MSNIDLAHRVEPPVEGRWPGYARVGFIVGASLLLWGAVYALLRLVF
jgi:hypothetical protein